MTTSTDIRILLAIVKREPIPSFSHQLSEELNIPLRTVQYCLRKLVKEKHIIISGTAINPKVPQPFYNILEIGRNTLRYMGYNATPCVVSQVVDNQSANPSHTLPLEDTISNNCTKGLSSHNCTKENSKNIDNREVIGGGERGETPSMLKKVAISQNDDMIDPMLGESISLEEQCARLKEKAKRSEAVGGALSISSEAAPDSWLKEKVERMRQSAAMSPKGELPSGEASPSVSKSIGSAPRRQQAPLPPNLDELSKVPPEYFSYYPTKVAALNAWRTEQKYLKQKNGENRKV